MRVSGEYVKLLKPGLCAIWNWSYYEPTKKRVRKLIKKHPEASCNLWIDAFNAGIEWARKNEDKE